MTPINHFSKNIWNKTIYQSQEKRLLPEFILKIISFSSWSNIKHWRLFTFKNHILNPLFHSNLFCKPLKHPYFDILLVKENYCISSDKPTWTIKLNFSSALWFVSSNTAIFKTSYLPNICFLNLIKSSSSGRILILFPSWIHMMYSKFSMKYVKNNTF